MSADLQSALTDIVLWLYHGFFVPGDRLLSLLNHYAPGVAEFLALDGVERGGVVSGFISAVAWLAAIILIMTICELIRDLDRTLTAFIVRLYRESQRVVRIVVRRLGIAIRAYALARRTRAARTEVFEQPALSGLQLAVLQSHAGLPPGHLLTPNDIAGVLHMRVVDIERVLGSLKKLSLVERTFGAGDGEDGYRLTRAGEVFLSACKEPLESAEVPQRPLRQKRLEPTLGSL